MSRVRIRKCKDFNVGYATPLAYEVVHERQVMAVIQEYRQTGLFFSYSTGALPQMWNTVVDGLVPLDQAKADAVQRVKAALKEVP